MKLSLIERWLLANQLQILETVSPDENGKRQFAEARTAIENGYEMHYDWLTQGFAMDQDVMTEDECGEVHQTLEMFFRIFIALDTYGANIDADERAVLVFGGYDGNNEGKFLSYTRYFITSDGGRLGELKLEGDLNSHMMRRARYGRQRRAWDESADKFDLNEDDLHRIAAAARHPGP